MPKASSPIGQPDRDGLNRRAHDPSYRAERERLLPFERIARMVIQRRSQKGWTQLQLAERMGTSHSVISRIESGQHQTSVETLKRLACALDTHLVLGFQDAPSAREHDLVAVC